MSWISEIATSKFKKYSQNGEEGYIGFILQNIGVAENGFLVDIGAGDGYSLSNTKYFRESRGFKHILLDGNNHGNTEVYEAWLTRDNILEILNFYHCPVRFDLLSIDLDGNDYHILKKVLSGHRPKLIVAEINPRFERYQSFTLPYDETHKWEQNDHYGVSLEALVKLGHANHYRLIFVNNSLNAYFLDEQFIPDKEEFIDIVYEKKQDFPHVYGEWEEVS